MAKKANAHFLEELYDLSVANALLIDEETGLELYSVSLETHSINQTAESELVKAGQNNDTFLEIKKKKLLNSSDLKDDKSIEYKAASMVGNEHVAIEISMKSSLHVKKNDGNKNGEDIATRVDKLSQRIIDLKSTAVFKALQRAHVALVRPPIKKTNVIIE